MTTSLSPKEPTPGARRTIEIPVPGWVGALAEPGGRASLVLISLSLAGLVALGLAWRGTASQLYVGFQLPFVASGDFGGVALIGAGAGLLAIHLERRAAATRRAAMDDIVRSAAVLAESVRKRVGRSQVPPNCIRQPIGSPATDAAARSTCPLVTVRRDVPPLPLPGVAGNMGR